MVDAQGQVQVANRYDPFGGLESATGQGRSAYGFAGEEQDEDSGHLFLRARTYNPETGRSQSVQQDSVMGDPMQPRSLHRYAYGFANPVNYTDPSGLMPDLGSRYTDRGGNSAAARAGGYAVRVETQVSPQAQYAAQVRRLGYNSSYLGSPNNGGIPRVSVARSVNGAAGQQWQTGSDPYARRQSQGHRLAPCGPMKRSPLDPLFAIRDTGQWIIDGVKADIEAMKADPVGYNRKRAEDWFNWTVDGLQKGWDIFKRDTARLKQDLQNDLHHSLQTLRQDPTRFARETAVATQRMWQQSRETISLTLDVIPVVGDIKGLVEGLVGVDLAGNEIGQHMRAVMVLAAIVGFFTFADEALAAGRLVDHLAGNADLAVDLLKSSKGLDHLDEGAGLVRHLDDGLLKQAPKVDDRLRALGSLDNAAFRSADDVAALRRLDTFTGGGNRTVSNAAEMRQRLTGNSGSGALSRRLEQQRAARQADGANCLFNSFTAGTPVHTDEGQKPIEEITLGDKVLAEDPETGNQGYFEVVALTSHPEDEILQITIEAEAKAEAEENTLDTPPSLTDNDDQQPNSDDTPSPNLQSPNLLQVTPDHPIYVEGQGWLWAENLSIGDTLRRADGGTAKVLAIERVKLDAPQLVYNFTVKGPHTYFVLEVGVLVHNVCNDYRVPLKGRQADLPNQVTVVETQDGSSYAVTGKPVWLNIDDIDPYHDLTETRFAHAFANIDSEGFDPQSPIVVVPDGDRFLIFQGHHRLSAVSELGYGKIPAIVLDDATAVQLHKQIVQVHGQIDRGRFFRNVEQLGNKLFPHHVARLKNPGGLPDAAFTDLADLTIDEARQIQSVVEDAGQPLWVVGSTAKGTRRNAGTNLPIGKGPGTRSDIDYWAWFKNPES